jgi:hypothetical protein
MIMLHVARIYKDPVEQQQQKPSKYHLELIVHHCQIRTNSYEPLRDIQICVGKTWGVKHIIKSKKWTLC